MAINVGTNNSTQFLTQLQRTRQGLNTSLERIAAGRRITEAASDPSGMLIADALGSQARGMGQALKNGSDAISIAQVADGALGESSEIISDIRANAVRAVNGAHSTESRAAIQAEISRSVESLNNIAQTTSFNGQKLLTGDFSNKAFQVGAGGGETISLSIGSAEAGKLGDPEQGTLASIDVTTVEGAEAAIGIADAALEQVNANRSNIGSTQNQLTSTISNLRSSRISALSAQSTIQDLDFAEEATNLAQLEALTKANTFAITQANAMNKSVLGALGISGDK